MLSISFVPEMTRVFFPELKNWCFLRRFQGKLGGLRTKSRRGDVAVRMNSWNVMYDPTSTQCMVYFPTFRLKFMEHVDKTYHTCMLCLMTSRSILKCER